MASLELRGFPCKWARQGDRLRYQTRNDDCTVVVDRDYNPELRSKHATTLGVTVVEVHRGNIPVGNKLTVNVNLLTFCADSDELSEFIALMKFLLR